MVTASARVTTHCRDRPARWLVRLLLNGLLVLVVC
jgi:hypothetical protein